MRSIIDFSSWSSALSTLSGLVLITLLMVGMRLLFMQTIQRKRERENRQINERLRTLIAAYKVLGGSFTGRLTVNPIHLREAKQTAHALTHPEESTSPPHLEEEEDQDAPGSSERQRRTRDAVEAALSDIILLGTEEQVRLAALSAQDMVAGRHIETAALVNSLRLFIREALDLEPLPADIVLPNQGPARIGATGGGMAGARRAGGAQAAGAGGGGRGGGGGGGGMGMGMGMGMGARHADDAPPPSL